MKTVASPYFKCYPSDFLSGVLGLEADCVCVYVIVLMMIYDRGEPIAEDAESLAWRCRMNLRRFKNVVDHLVTVGKLTRSDGRLSNGRAEEELIKRQEASEKQAVNANARWDKSDKKDNKNKEPKMPPQCDGNAILESIVQSSKNLKVLCPKPVRARTAYSEDFEEFWKAYPTDANMPKKDAYEAWKKLSPEDRKAAFDSISGFLSYCKGNSDYRPVYADRYLKQRRFEGHLSAAQRLNAMVFAKCGTPQFQAWDEYLRASTGKPAMISEKRGGWEFPGEWPPNFHEKLRGAA